MQAGSKKKARAQTSRDNCVVVDDEDGADASCAGGLDGCGGGGSVPEAECKHHCVDSDDESGEFSGYRMALGVLKASSLSEKTKNDLPSPMRVDVTFRNINWLLHYWQCVPPVQRNVSTEESSLREEGESSLREEGESSLREEGGECGKEDGDQQESAMVSTNKCDQQDQHWDYSSCYPDPVCDTYGFRRTSARKGGAKSSNGGKVACAVKWLDECENDADEEDKTSKKKRKRVTEKKSNKKKGAKCKHVSTEEEEEDESSDSDAKSSGSSDEDSK